jgi:hypothetical protein
MKIPMKILACCAATREMFEVDAEQDGAQQRWLRGRRIALEQRAESQTRHTHAPPREVVVDATGFVCPVCSTGAGIMFCTQCQVTHCQGRSRDGKLLGACGNCRWDSLGPPVASFAIRSEPQL